MHLKADDYPTLTLGIDIFDNATLEIIKNAKCQIIIDNETEDCLPYGVKSIDSYSDTLNIDFEYPLNLPRTYFIKKYYAKITHPDYQTVHIEHEYEKCNGWDVTIKVGLKAKEEKACRNITDIISDIDSINYISARRVTIGGVDTSYLKFIELKNCASEQELLELINVKNSSNLIALAWKTLAYKNPNKAITLFSKTINSEIHKKEPITKRISRGDIEKECTIVNKIYNEMVFVVEEDIRDFVKEEIYQAILKKEIILKYDELIDFLNHIE